MVPGIYLLLSKCSANYFYMAREASVNSEWFLETSNWECCINWVLKGYNWCYLSEESSPSKILHDHFFFPLRAMPWMATLVANTLNTIWKGWGEAGPVRLTPGGQEDLLTASSQISDMLYWCLKLYDIAREIYACIEKIISINIGLWNLYGYVTKSSLLFTVYSKTNERKTNSIPQIQVRRVHSFILPHLSWTSPKRKEQANKKSMSC